MFKTYYNLTKPGIIYGNSITAIAGFLLASRGHFDFKLFVAMLAGLALVIGSACVLNNIYDREIDKKMERTRHRAVASGLVSKGKAFIFAFVLIILGIMVLRFHTTITALEVGLFGFFIYVFVYTPLKHRSVHATLVGALAGAVPPVVGYTAVTDKLDLGAWLLFLILVAWQMPHFYAIAIRRLDEYAVAHIPVLPIKKGIWKTKVHIVVFIVIYTWMTVLLFAYKYTGPVYLGVVIVLGLMWLLLALQGFKEGTEDRKWARKLFLFSLVDLLILSLAISLSGIMHT